LLHHAAPLSTSYFFFFHRSRPHRDLHSFPTRRSSDLRFAKPDSRNQAQDHRAQRGNETQREVSTGVVFETIFTREQVQEPLVEAVSKIVVLVPVRGETREIMLSVPLWRNTHVRPVKIRWRRGIQRPH